MAQGSATITIQPTVFNNVITDGTQCPINAMTLTPGGDTRVRLTGTTAPNGIKIVTGTPADCTALNLTFVLDASLLAGGTPSYNLAFILFGAAGSAGVFTNKYGNSTNSITVAVVLGSATAPNFGKWEFFVGIQKGSGAAGQIGIIDPPIENDAS